MRKKIFRTGWSNRRGVRWLLAGACALPTLALAGAEAESQQVTVVAKRVDGGPVRNFVYEAFSMTTRSMNATQDEDRFGGQGGAAAVLG